ncbi:MAG: glutaminase A [Deltaproteobacteria bacterium]|nr:glutaminase A [Deltaproteobacteria bacterium]
MHTLLVPSPFRRAAALAAVAVAASACTASVAKEKPAASAARTVAAVAPVPPGQESFQALVADAHARFAGVTDGKNADYIPILATIPSELFGVAIATRDGHVYAAGDVDYRFSIQSVAKPFTAALVMQQYGGPEIIAERIGVEPTGLPFNSKLALEIYKARSVNPLVNAGAIAAVSLVKAKNEKDRWEKVKGNLEGFAGEKLPLLEKVYDSEYSTAWGNRGIASLLYNWERLYCDAEEALRVYTKECSVGINTRDLAIMGATLANGGVNPKTGERMLDETSVPELLAIMQTAGFYDESGRWSFDAGLPSKTGVGGGIVAVVPGRYAIAAFSPRLNAAGNSVRAQKAIRYIAGKLGAGVFGPNPEQ